MEWRQCPLCKIGRPAVSFIDGRWANMCQVCADTMYSAPDDQVRKTYIDDRAAGIVNSVRSRSKKSNLPFDLTISWVRERLEAGHCEVTKIPFSMEFYEGISHPFTPSIDRTMPIGGYTQRNCKMVIWMYNAAKGSHDAKFVKIMARALCGKLSQKDIREIEERDYTDAAAEQPFWRLNSLRIHDDGVREEEGGQP